MTVAGRCVRSLRPLASTFHPDTVLHARRISNRSSLRNLSRLNTARRQVHSLGSDDARKLVPTMADLGLRNGDHVTVAMSGGVDSATTLRILSELPIDLDVIFMKNWDPLLSESPSSSAQERISLSYPSTTASTRKEGNFSPCQWEKDWTDVLRIANHVGLPKDKVKMVDLSQEYWTRVFEPAVNVWERGGTPNPDVDCNREIKFGALLDLLPRKERHFIATGHYARVDRSHGDGTSRLFRATDPSKDQTYYLSQMNESQLARTIFPLGRIVKSSVRKLAEYWSLPNARKEESMGVCFIGERGKFGDFVSQYTSPPELGHLVSPSGDKLAPHKGMWYYTIGQRAKIPDQLQAMYVAKKGVGENGLDILVVPGLDHPMLVCEEIHTSDFHWIHGHPPPVDGDGSSGTFLIQDRHRMTPIRARIQVENDKRVTVIPLERLTGVSPGQVIAIWNDEWCLGSGVISRTKCKGDIT